VAVSRDGRFIATGTRGGVMCLRRAEDGALLHCLVAHEGPVSAIDFARDRVATASWSGEVSTWRLPSLARIETRRVGGSANDVAFSPDGSALAIATSREPPIRSPAVVERERRAAASPDPLAAVEVVAPDGTTVTCKGHSEAVSSVAWTPDGGALVSGSWDRSVRLWNRATCRELDRISGLDHIVRGVATGANGRWAAAAAWAIEAEEPSSLLLDLLYTVD
jgi:COMPASS component SWD3